MDSCPRCGKAMEVGYLGAKNWPTGIQWFRDKTFFGLRGEPIGESDSTQMAWLASSRCPDCRLILASY